MTGAAFLNTPSVPKSVTQLQYVSNATLSASVPADFKAIVQELRGPKLTSVLCLQIAVHLIDKHLALEDFTRRIPGQGWSHCNVVISVSTQEVEGNSIEKRYIIWGIFEALSKMVREKNFNSALFRLEWRGVLVGS